MDPEYNLVKSFKKPYILDTHNDTMLRIIHQDTWLPRVDLGSSTDFHIDIPKLQKGGLNIPFFAAYTEGFGENTNKSISRTLALINALYFTEKKNSDSLKIIKSFKDIVDAINDGKIAAVPAIEGSYSLDRDYSFELLHQYKDLGIKAITLTWNYSNALGEGASKTYNDKSKTPSSGGLTEHGKNIIAEMEWIGILVDISHIDEGTFWDVMEVAKAPVIASHSGVDRIKQHVRNLKDDQLKAIKETGGVVNIVFYPGFLGEEDSASSSEIVDHIDYVVDLIGIDYVGLGSDFDGDITPKDLKDAGEIGKIRDELKNRRYGEEDIQKVLGGNMLRVLKEVEDKSEEKRASENIEIIPSFSMGEKIDVNPLILKAEIMGDMDTKNASIILDGKRYKDLFDRDKSQISLSLENPLKEKFHIATFEVEDVCGEIKRETRIFYSDFSFNCK